MADCIPLRGEFILSPLQFRDGGHDNNLTGNFWGILGSAVPKGCVGVRGENTLLRFFANGITLVVPGDNLPPYLHGTIGVIPAAKVMQNVGDAFHAVSYPAAASFYRFDMNSFLCLINNYAMHRDIII